MMKQKQLKMMLRMDSEVHGGSGRQLVDKVRRQRGRDSDEENVRSSASTPKNSTSDSESSGRLPRNELLHWSHTSEEFTVARGSLDQRAIAQRQEFPVLAGEVMSGYGARECAGTRSRQCCVCIVMCM